MQYTDNSLNILTAKSYKGIGNAWIVKNLRGNEDIPSIVSLINKKNKEKPTTLDEFKQAKDLFKTKITRKFEGYCDGFIAWGDPKFPQYRGLVKESERPVFLYYKGDIDLLSIYNKNISVIGLLNPTTEIEIRERNIVSELVKNGATIVSGLALGCDSVSHQQALDSKGKTVAILPSPLNNILPVKNKNLALRIVEQGGLLVTEYGNDFKSKMELSSRYKERDRLQALFCDTIVLAASYAQNSAETWKIIDQKLDSGARLAMEYAKEYNIPRAVMYDQNIDESNPMFDLNRNIIKDSKNITVLPQNNFVTSVKEMMIRSNEFKKTIQARLF